MKKGLKLDPKDNIGVVIDDVKAGDEVTIDTEVILAKEDIGMPHKVALRDIKNGENILKYGNVFGYATKDILKGEHVHIHNVDSEKLMK